MKTGKTNIKLMIYPILIVVLTSFVLAAITVTLNDPLNNYEEAYPENMSFNCSATTNTPAYPLTELNLYTDIAGSFALSDTQSFAQAPTIQANFNYGTNYLQNQKKVVDGKFNWTCYAKSTANENTPGSIYNFTSWNRGTFSNTAYNSTENAISLTSTSGDYVSRIFYTPQISTWQNLRFSKSFGYLNQELPNPGVIEDSTKGGINNTGLVLLYHMNENGNNVIDDYSNYKNDGNKVGAINKTGKFGDAQYFDGVNDQIWAYDSDSLDISSQYTISFWINRNSKSSSNIERVISKSKSVATGTRDYSYWVQIYTSNGAINSGFVKSDGYTHVAINSNGTIPLNRWTHVAVTKNSTEFAVYIDGKLDSSGVSVGTMGDAEKSDFPLHIGSLCSDEICYYNFNGSMDEISIWNRSLDHNEIRNMYKRGILGFDVQIKSCADFACSDNTGWSDSVTCNDSQSESCDISSLDDSQYIQYRLNFSTQNQNYSQKISSVTINYQDQNIFSGCGDLNESKLYTFTANSISNQSCLNITSSIINIDCKGNIINYSVSGNPGHGLYAKNKRYVDIKNCVFVTGNESALGTYAMYFENVSNLNLENIEIRSISNDSTGVLLNKTNLTNISGITINMTGKNNKGIHLLDSNSINIDSANIRITGIDSSAVFFNSSNNNTLESFTIILDNETASNFGYGVYFANSMNNLIKDSQIENEFGDSIHIEDASSKQNTFENVIFNNLDSSKFDVRLASPGIDGTSFIDTSIDRYMFENPGSIINFEDTYEAKISFSQPINGTGNHLKDSNQNTLINISENSVKVRSDLEQGLNKSANITFYMTNIFDLYNRFPYKNAIPCPVDQCTELSDSNTYIFNTTGFSNFSVGEDAKLVYGCLDINTSEQYMMMDNFSSSGTCINITAPNSILNCNNHTINYSNSATLGYGIIVNANNVTIRNCNIIEGTSNTDNKHGIYINKSNNARIYNVDVTTTGIASQGINIFDSNDTTIDGLIINTYGHNAKGISLNNSIRNIFEDIIIKTNGINASGIDIKSGNSSFNITNSDINASDSSAYDLMIDSKSNGSEFNFYNATFSKRLFNDTSNSIIKVFWFLDVNVTDEFDSPLIDIYVIGSDIYDNTIFNEITNDRGFITRQKILEYNETRNTRLNATSITLSIFETGYDNFITTFNVTQNTRIDAILMQNEIFDICQNFTSPGYYSVLGDINIISGDCFNIQSDGVTIDLSGYTVTGNGNMTQYAIYSQGYDDVRIIDGIIQNFETGIYLENSNNNIIENLDLDQNPIGIYLNGSNSNLINMTLISNSDTGIRLDDSDYNTIERSTITDYAYYGAHFSQSAYNNLSFDTITNPLSSQDSIAIMLSGDQGSSPNNIFRNVTINPSGDSYDLAVYGGAIGRLSLIDTPISKYDLNYFDAGGSAIISFIKSGISEITYLSPLVGFGSHLNDEDPNAAVQISGFSVVMRQTQSQNSTVYERANITFYNTPFFIDSILRNGVVCSDMICTNTQFGQNLRFVREQGQDSVEVNYSIGTTIPSVTVQALPSYSVSDASLQIIAATYLNNFTNVTIEVVGQYNGTGWPTRVYYLTLDDDPNDGQYLIRTSNNNMTSLNTSISVGAQDLFIPRSDMDKVSAGMYIEFDNYKRINFTGYLVAAVATTSNPNLAKITLSLGVEHNISAGATISIRNQSLPAGWFNQTITLFPGYNNITIWQESGAFRSNNILLPTVFYSNITPIIDISRISNFTNTTSPTINFMISNPSGINQSYIWILQNNTQNQNITAYRTSSSKINITINAGLMNITSEEFVLVDVNGSLGQNISCVTINSTNINCSVRLNLSLIANTSNNKLTIWAKSNAGISNNINLSITYDPSPPNISKIIIVDEGNVITKKNLTIHLNMTNGSAIILNEIEPESGIEYFELALGTAKYPNSGWDSLFGFINISNNTTYTTQNLNLQPAYEYYFSLRIKNGAGSYSGIITSDGIVFMDNSAPLMGPVSIARYTSDPTKITASWTATENDSQIVGYEAIISRIAYPNPGWSDPENIFGSITINSSSTDITTDIPTNPWLIHNQSYSVNVRVKNSMYLQSDWVSTTTPILYDSTPPFNGSINYTQPDVNGMVWITIIPGTDAESNIVRSDVYMARVQYINGACQNDLVITDETPIRSYNFSQPSPANQTFSYPLENGWCYDFLLKTTDGASLASAWINSGEVSEVFNNTSPFNQTIIERDNTPPDTFRVFDTPNSWGNLGTLTYDGTKLVFTWDSAIDNESGIKEYRVWINETYTGSDTRIVFWPDYNQSSYTTIPHTGQSTYELTANVWLNNSNISDLQNQYKYYLFVQAINNNDNPELPHTTTEHSDGIIYIDIYPPALSLIGIGADNSSPYFISQDVGDINISFLGEKNMKGCVWSKSDIPYRSPDTVAFNCSTSPISNQSNCLVPVSNLSEGINRIHISCRDKNGVVNDQTNNLDLTFTLDRYAPNITIIPPNQSDLINGVIIKDNTTFKYNDLVFFSINITDLSLDSVWYNLSNQTYHTLANETLVYSSGEIRQLLIPIIMTQNNLQNMKFTLFANDTFGKMSNRTFNFTYDNTEPWGFAYLESVYDSDFTLNVTFNYSVKVRFNITLDGMNMISNLTDYQNLTNGIYSFDINTSNMTKWVDGLYWYDIILTNDFNYTYVINNNFTYDTNFPNVTIHAPNETDLDANVIFDATEGLIYRGDTVDIGFEASDISLKRLNYELKFYNGTGIITKNLTESFITTHTQFGPSLINIGNATIDRDGIIYLTLKNNRTSDIEIENSHSINNERYDLLNTPYAQSFTLMPDETIILIFDGRDFINSTDLGLNITLYYLIGSTPGQLTGFINATTKPMSSYVLSINQADYSNPINSFKLNVTATDSLGRTTSDEINFTIDNSVQTLNINKTFYVAIEDFAFRINANYTKNLTYDIKLLDPFNQSYWSRRYEIFSNGSNNSQTLREGISWDVSRINTSNYVEGLYTIKATATDRFEGMIEDSAEIYFVRPRNMSSRETPNPVNNTKSTFVNLTINRTMISNPTYFSIGYWTDGENYTEINIEPNLSFSNNTYFTFDYKQLLNAKNITYTWIIDNESGRIFASTKRLINVTLSPYRQNLTIDTDEDLTVKYVFNQNSLNQVFNQYTGTGPTANMSLDETRRYDVIITNANQTFKINVSDYNFTILPNTTTSNLTAYYRNYDDVVLNNIELVSPSNSHVENGSASIIFRFSVTDMLTDIYSCDLVINESVKATVYNPEESEEQNISFTLKNGDYDWKINCADGLGIIFESDTLNLTVNFSGKILETDYATYNSTGIVMINGYDWANDINITINISSTAGVISSSTLNSSGNGGFNISHNLNSANVFGDYTIFAYETNNLPNNQTLIFNVHNKTAYSGLIDYVIKDAHIIEINAQNYAASYALTLNYSHLNISENSNLSIYKLDYVNSTIVNYTKNATQPTLTYRNDTTKILKLNTFGRSALIFVESKNSTITNNVEICGNNIVETGEECDAGPSASPTCSSTCTVITPQNNEAPSTPSRGGGGGGGMMISSPKANCSDGKKNQNEEGIDCGGICGKYWYNNKCNTYPQITTSCLDGIKNQNEEGIDCGGICLSKCADSQQPSNIGTCYDGIKNQDETMIDCGGVCGRYWYDNQCNLEPDYYEESCFDNIQNQDENGIDCEGVCITSCKTKQDITLGMTLPFMIIGGLIILGSAGYVLLTRKKSEFNYNPQLIPASETDDSLQASDVETPIAVEEQDNTNLIDAQNSDITQLVDYINSQQSMGKTSYDIKKALLMVSWPISLIEQAFEQSEETKKIKGLEEYIKKARARGYSDNVIRKTLIDANWAEPFIELVIRELHKKNADPQKIRDFAMAMFEKKYSKEEIIRHLASVGWDPSTIYDMIDDEAFETEET